MINDFGHWIPPRIKYGVTFFRRNDGMSSHTHHYKDFGLLADGHHFFFGDEQFLQLEHFVAKVGCLLKLQ